MTSIDAPFVAWTDGDGARREFVLSGDLDKVTVGRDPGAQIALAHDDQVSRLHATLERVGPHWTVVDDGLSRNGTFVNGERLAGRRRLRTGDAVRTGATLLVFRDLSRSRSTVTRVAEDLPTVRSLTDTQLAVLVALCRPFRRQAVYATPATNQQIAEELFLSVDAVKTHLRVLFSKFAVENLPQNVKRVRLVERALSSGVVSDRDL